MEERKDNPQAFAALAEAHRRAGRPEEAERVARAGLVQRPDWVAGRVALGLALLDLGRLREARRQLEQVIGELPAETLLSRPRPRSARPAAAENPLADALDTDEFERAFERAETDREQVVDADRIAVEAMHQVDREEAEALRATPDSPFATRTVADLLERQGDASGAQAVRAALARREATSTPPRSGRQRAIATLERWLDNLGRGKA